MKAQFLPTIDSPGDLKKLTVENLPDLAQEIRTEIIDVCNQNGGHLASSLGVVELGIALHYVYDSPIDQIVWDVGHQAYTHKILTGRRESFRGMRTKNGISGFPTRIESEHDPFGVGHSSTSISAAVGLAVAKRLSGAEGCVIAVIGDSALTGGMAMEALNHLADLKENVLVIINENGRSIDEVQGEIAKQEIFADFVRGFGLEAEKKIVDGHDLNELIKELKRLQQEQRENPGPRILRVKTIKGFGYEAAVKRPAEYHGVEPGFLERDAALEKLLAAGRKVSTKPKLQTWSDVVGLSLLEIMKQDKKVVVVCPAMTSRSGLSEVAREFPERFFDPGIVEQHAVTLTAGLAAGGMKPFLSIYSTFLQRGYDQLIHDIGIQKLPVRILVDRAGMGADRATHDGIYDLQYLRTVPNLRLGAANSAVNLARMIGEAWRNDWSATAVRFPGLKMDEAEAEEIEKGLSDFLMENAKGFEVKIKKSGSKKKSSAQRLGRKRAALITLGRIKSPPYLEEIEIWREQMMAERREIVEFNFNWADLAMKKKVAEIREEFEEVFYMEDGVRV